MTWVKICGTTNLEDALLAVDAGADAVGFVFYEKSPRCVTVETAREICEKLPGSVEKVGVFVNESAERIDELVHAAGLTAVQIYAGDVNGSSSGESREFPMLEYKVIAAVSSEQLQPNTLITSAIPGVVAYALLVDSGSGERPGGTGRVFSWDNKKEMIHALNSQGSKVIVAGGLRPDNVSAAMLVLKPWGVDVVSGVEARPGKKDPEKVWAFVKAVRDMDRKVG
jgi:phosphoribosylanthranilate isomerase